MSIIRKSAQTFAICWELARFHSNESCLEWFAAMWGACFAAGDSKEPLDSYQVLKSLAGIWLCMTVVHGAWCTGNDIIDRHIDAGVERTKYRPLPSGRISVQGALVSCAFLTTLAATLTYYCLGRDALLLSIPMYFLNAIYPYMKQLIPWPQLVLAPAVGWTSFIGWSAIAGNLDDLEKCVPLFLAASCWTLYYDTFYGSQDAEEDKKIGVKSLPIWLGTSIHPFLCLLGTLIIGLISLSAHASNVSYIFWTFAIGVWALLIPYQITQLNLKDRTSGGKIFKQNIKFGMYVTWVAFAELAYQSFSPKF